MATYTPSSPFQIVNTFDEIVPSSAASSSATPLLRPSASFDVFINHCGVDVKYTLATTISHKLTALGISVFLDAHSLQLGDVIPAQIQEAIRTATLHIAIFSVNYADSPWCLAELSSMLKTGNRIIPVFYHVDPSDLRWVGQGKGIYAAAFSQYQLNGRYSEEKLDEWRRAL
ncbi:probable 2' cyclic ADP-D-ribose synthase BdTIR [Cryptomeria japonica]|uniref:probable 2' cyclic ADP-D-ribose synthase BdTIR n=1 Tax=Cryptomeria japonica TaxID=3369 RepID=UPI0027D9D31F|nr:probable 2' cyclic ADP-D-ribose synthase BdTIR [Cryptomeria japonica]